MSLKENREKILLLISSIFFLDQITKFLASQFLAPHRVIKVLPFLNLVYVENTGTAFGLFRSFGSAFFIFTASAATLLLGYLMLKDSKNWFAYSLIIGGAIGNITDRLFRGYVIDFVDLYLGNFHWPAFNIADTAISIGMVLFIYRSIKK